MKIVFTTGFSTCNASVLDMVLHRGEVSHIKKPTTYRGFAKLRLKEVRKFALRLFMKVLPFIQVSMTICRLLYKT